MTMTTQGLHIHILLRLAELKPLAGETPSMLAVGMAVAFNEVLGLIQPLSASDNYLTDAEQKAQAARCGCRGHDDYCVCQNVPDSQTVAARPKPSARTTA